MSLEFTRRISENGKLTVPKEIRELQDIQEGDYVRIRILEVIPRGERPRREPPANGHGEGS